MRQKVFQILRHEFQTNLGVSNYGHAAKRAAIGLACISMLACAGGAKKDKGDSRELSMSPAEIELDQGTNSNSSAGRTESAEDSKSKKTQNQSAPTAPLANTDIQRLKEAIQVQDWTRLEKVSVEILLQRPTDLQALNAMGLASYRKGRPKVAIHFFSKALQIQPRSSELYNNLGLAHLQNKDRKEARSAFKKALEINSRDPVAAANLGSLYLAEGDEVKASIPLEIAAAAFSQDAKVLNNYAVALIHQKKFAEAEEKLKTALKSSASSRELIFNLALIQIEELKKPAEGLEMIQKLKFYGVPPELRSRTNDLENRAKSALK